MYLRNTLRALALLVATLFIAQPVMAAEMLSTEPLRKMQFSDLLCSSSDGSLVEFDLTVSWRGGSPESFANLIEISNAFKSTCDNMDTFEMMQDWEARPQLLDQWLRNAQQTIHPSLNIELMDITSSMMTSVKAADVIEQLNEQLRHLQSENDELKDQIKYNRSVARVRVAAVLLIILFLVGFRICRGLKKDTDKILDS
jgi:hypothetical protein